MAFREVSVVGIKEVLRLWLRGHGRRTIAGSEQLDRKTVRRYVAAAQAAGLSRTDDEEALTDQLLGVVVEAIRPSRPPGDHGRAWETLLAHRAFLEAKLEDDLQLTTVHRLLVRHGGAAVPYRTLHRFCVQELGHGGSDNTVRVDDSDPGEELQVDFGRMGVLLDPVTGRRRVAWALIFTAVFSRRMCVWLTFTQGLTDVIAGFEAAWGFFGGVFKVVIVDNFKATVIEADAISCFSSAEDAAEGRPRSIPTRVGEGLPGGRRSGRGNRQARQSDVEVEAQIDVTSRFTAADTPVIQWAFIEHNVYVGCGDTKLLQAPDDHLIKMPRR
jgi:hypothetical protein